MKRIFLPLLFHALIIKRNKLSSVVKLLASNDMSLAEVGFHVLEEMIIILLKFSRIRFMCRH